MKDINYPIIEVPNPESNTEKQTKARTCPNNTTKMQKVPLKSPGNHET